MKALWGRRLRKITRVCEGHEENVAKGPAVGLQCREEQPEFLGQFVRAVVNDVAELQPKSVPMGERL
jgi:hypothetical protein